MVIVKSLFVSEEAVAPVGKILVLQLLHLLLLPVIEIKVGTVI